MKNKQNNAHAAPVLGGARFIRAKQLMPLLGYSDPASFWQAIRQSGCPFYRINSQRILFEESAVRDWLKSREVRAAQASMNCGNPQLAATVATAAKEAGLA